MDAKVILFDEWDDGYGMLLARNVKIPFVPIPGLVLTLRGPDGTEDDVVVTSVNFREGTGHVLCQVSSSSMGQMSNNCDSGEEFQLAYKAYLSMGFGPTCARELIGEPYPAWDRSKYKPWMGVPYAFPS